uniref:Uncharacterized protein n=1 Tax=Trichobilharzia regenti TaxID=157069 RepID=A0AA85IZI4_TRIRE|nr:unnamed protein product [Trichobilharzia regenti]
MKFVYLICFVTCLVISGGSAAPSGNRIEETQDEQAIGDEEFENDTDFYTFADEVSAGIHKLLFGPAYIQFHDEIQLNQNDTDVPVVLEEGI